MALSVNQATVAYANGARAVEDLSFRVRQGEIYGLLGLNGAGKTSLIKAVATLLRPAAGSIRVLGLDTRDRPADIKRRIGVVPQENNLDTYLDVRRNLVFHCRYAGLPKKVYAPRVEEWLALLGLEQKAGERVLHLSGGTRRKVMLAKAFLTDPELLVLDEPSAGLDPEIRAQLWEQVREFRRRGGTVLLSTHYLEEAERLCDRIGVLHRGRLAAEEPAGNGVEAVFRRATGEAP